MFNFIDNQTNWYKEKTEQIKKTIILIRLETPKLQYEFYTKKIRDLFRAKQALLSTAAISSLFGANIDEVVNLSILSFDIGIKNYENKLKALDYEPYKQGGYKGIELNPIQGLKQGEYIYTHKKTNKL